MADPEPDWRAVAAALAVRVARFSGAISDGSPLVQAAASEICEAMGMVEGLGAQALAPLEGVIAMAHRMWRDPENAVLRASAIAHGERHRGAR